MQNFSKGMKAILPFKQSKISTMMLPKGSREHNVVLASGPLPNQVLVGVYLMTVKYSLTVSFKNQKFFKRLR